MRTTKSSAGTIRMSAILALAGAVFTAQPSLSAQLNEEPPLIPESSAAKSKQPDIANGNILARKLCTTCHLIGEPANAPVPSDVPTFASIANQPDQTAEHLSTWLTRPHPPMPNLDLTRTEIRDLAGYILSLRDEK